MCPRADRAALQARYEAMQAFETEATLSGCVRIAGIDEAGRGPLAGPVTAAACVLDPGRPILGLDDSKKLSPCRREILYRQITDLAAGWSVASVSARDIDRLGILEATRMAMKTAVSGLPRRPDRLLVDAVDLSDTGIACLAILHGDARSVSIAAASILAKVTRDRYMDGLHLQYPGYGFDRHRGYGTREHYEALFRLGPCPEHRDSFLKTLDRHRNPAAWDRPEDRPPCRP